MICRDSKNKVFHNLLYFADQCFPEFLQLDTAYFLDGAMGAPTFGIEPVTYTQNAANGRFFVRFRLDPSGADVDGPGGLDDIDGDGVDNDEDDDADGDNLTA